MNWWLGARQGAQRNFRRWWKIDVLTLGFGLLIGGLAWRRSPDSASFWESLMTNLASEFLGVWLGVRIIEFLISNHEEYHRVRRNVLNVIESCSELSRKILIKSDPVFLEEFMSRRSVADRIYRRKPRMFSVDELADFACWVEEGDVFEIAGRLYFQHISDLKTAQNTLQATLGEHLERLDGNMDEAGELVPCSRLLDEPWSSKLNNGLEDFVHNHGRLPERTAATIRSNIFDARTRLVPHRFEVRRAFDAWFAEVEKLFQLRSEFDASYSKFHRASEKLITNILERTEE